MVAGPTVVSDDRRHIQHSIVDIGAEYPRAFGFLSTRRRAMEVVGKRRLHSPSEARLRNGLGPRRAAH